MSLKYDRPVVIWPYYFIVTLLKHKSVFKKATLDILFQKLHLLYIYYFQIFVVFYWHSQKLGYFLLPRVTNDLTILFILF